MLRLLVYRELRSTNAQLWSLNKYRELLKNAVKTLEQPGRQGRALDPATRFQAETYFRKALDAESVCRKEGVPQEFIDMTNAKYIERYMLLTAGRTTSALA